MISLTFPNAVGVAKTIALPDESGEVAIKKNRRYEVQVSQSGTNTPTVFLHNNDTGLTITWSRTAKGQYQFSLAGNFSQNCIFLASATGQDIAPNVTRIVTRITTDATPTTFYHIDTYLNGVLEDGVLDRTSVLLWTYPF